MAFTRNSALEATFLAIALLLLFLTGIFAAMSAGNLKKNSAFGRDPTLNKARNYLIWSSVIAFVGFFLVLLMLILFFVFRDKAASWKVVSLILSVITLMLAFISGILAAIGSMDMKKSRNYTGTGSDNAANTEAIVASVVSLAGIGILLIVYIVFKLFIQTNTGESYVPEIPGRTKTVEMTSTKTVTTEPVKLEVKKTIAEAQPLPLPRRVSEASLPAPPVAPAKQKLPVRIITPVPDDE